MKIFSFLILFFVCLSSYGQIQKDILGCWEVCSARVAVKSNNSELAKWIEGAVAGAAGSYIEKQLTFTDKNEVVDERGIDYEYRIEGKKLITESTNEKNTYEYYISNDTLYLTEDLKEKYNIVLDSYSSVLGIEASEDETVLDTVLAVYTYVRLFKEGEVDTSPEFLGGAVGLSEFLEKNMKYPSPDRDGSKFGVMVIIDKDGFIRNDTQARRHDGLEFGGKSLSDYTGAIRDAVEKMPKWFPATKDGEPVNMLYNLLIKF